MGMQRRINNIGSQGSQGSQTIQTIQAETQRVLDCINDKIGAIGASTNTIFNGQYDIADLEAEIAQEQASIDIAKQRLESIRNPEKHTSPYQSWFPIDRPIQPITLIVLMSLTIFISVFLLLMVLSAAGIDLTIITAVSTTSPINRYGFMYWLRSQLTTSFFVLAAILLAVIIYFVKRS